MPGMPAFESAGIVLDSRFPFDSFTSFRAGSHPRFAHVRNDIGSMAGGGFLLRLVLLIPNFGLLLDGRGLGAGHAVGENFG
jgi:hypothetical protein